MISPKKPENEHARLEVLDSLAVLDTNAETVFDNLTQLVSEHLNFPIAAISLVDINRQWFKSTIGLDVCETSRDISFCGHTVAENNVLAVCDAKSDPRFHDNPLVTGNPFIGSYFGLPLRPEGDFIVGTLCVMDRVPRQLTSNEQDFLVKMALQAEHLLNLSKSISKATLQKHQLVHERRRNQNSKIRQNAILNYSKTGMVMFNEFGTIFDVNEQMLDWMGLEPQHILHTNIKELYPFPILENQTVLEHLCFNGATITLDTVHNQNHPFMLSVNKIETDGSAEFVACFDEITVKPYN